MADRRQGPAARRARPRDRRGARVPRGVDGAAARGHAGLLHRRADRPAGARGRARPLHRGRGAGDAPRRGRPWWPARTSRRSPRPPRRRFPGTSTTTWRSWWSSRRPVDLATWEASFPAEPIRVSQARKSALYTLTGWGLEPEQAKLACLLVSEVVTNAVLHAAVSPSPRRELALETAGASPVAAMPAGSWDEPAGRHRAASPPDRSRCGCGAAGRRSGSRCSTPTCGCRGSAARARPTRADAGCTWWTRSPPGGAPGPPGTARPSGSRYRSTGAASRAR